MASPPDRRRPSLRGARAWIAGGLRVRGAVWLCSMVWVVIGACGAVYLAVAFAHPGYGEGLLIPPTIQWPGEPQVLNAVAVTAEVTWFLLAGPVLLAGLVWILWHRRGGRARSWRRAAGWTASWVAGLSLVGQTKVLASAGLDGASSGLVIGALAICAAWLVLGALMSRMLVATATRRSDVSTTGTEHAARLA